MAGSSAGATIQGSYLARSDTMTNVAIYDGTHPSAVRDTIYKLRDRTYQFFLLDDGNQYDLINRKVIFD